MSEIINWLAGNTIFIVNYTRFGDPAGHIEDLNELSPFQQWIFRDVDEALEAAKQITVAIQEKCKGTKLDIKRLEDITKQSEDILLSLALIDESDDTVQARIYITAYRKNGRVWS